MNIWWFVSLVKGQSLFFQSVGWSLKKKKKYFGWFLGRVWSSGIFLWGVRRKFSFINGVWRYYRDAWLIHTDSESELDPLSAIPFPPDAEWLHVHHTHTHTLTSAHSRSVCVRALETISMQARHTHTPLSSHLSVWVVSMTFLVKAQPAFMMLVFTLRGFYSFVTRRTEQAAFE